MKRGIPSLNWLRVFEAAARMENFARAAELLNMSTSAVSQQIKALESHLGEDLFNRGARNVELTDVGHAYLPTVRQSLASIEETTASLFGRDKDNTLRLQVDLNLALSWLTERLPDFSRHYPQVQLHLIGAYHDLDFQRPGFDLRILFGPVHRSWGQCDRLYAETIYPVASPQIAASIHSAEDFLKHRLIQISTHQVNWNQLLQSVGIDTLPSRQLCFTDATQLALNMAVSGYGIALARAPTTNRLVEKLGLEACAACPGMHSSEAYYLSYRNLESLSGSARNFRTWLLQEVERLQT